MPNQHEHSAKTFRPDTCHEYAPARTVLTDAGVDMNRFLRACLRWLVADPAAALRTVTPHLPPVAFKGRRKPSEPICGVGNAENPIGPALREIRS